MTDAERGFEDSWPTFMRCKCAHIVFSTRERSGLSARGIRERRFENDQTRVERNSGYKLIILFGVCASRGLCQSKRLISLFFGLIRARVGIMKS